MQQNVFWTVRDRKESLSVNIVNELIQQAAAANIYEPRLYEFSAIIDGGERRWGDYDYAIVVGPPGMDNFDWANHHDGFWGYIGEDYFVVDLHWTRYRAMFCRIQQPDADFEFFNDATSPSIREIVEPHFGRWLTITDFDAVVELANKTSNKDPNYKWTPR